MSKRRLNGLQLRQIKFTNQSLIRKRQRLIQLLRIQPSLAETLKHPLLQHRIEVPNPNALAIQLFQKLLDLFGPERLLDRGLQLGIFLFLLNLDRSLFKRHFQLLSSRARRLYLSRRSWAHRAIISRDWCASKFLERETGIEPATNSLEGCDSTTELLPPSPQRLKPLSFRLQAA